MHSDADKSPPAPISPFWPWLGGTSATGAAVSVWLFHSAMWKGGIVWALVLEGLTLASCAGIAAPGSFAAAWLVRKWETRAEPSPRLALAVAVAAGCVAGTVSLAATLGTLYLLILWGLHALGGSIP